MEQLIEELRQAVEETRAQVGAEAQEALTLILGGLDVLAEKRGPSVFLLFRAWRLSLHSALLDMKRRYR